MSMEVQTPPESRTTTRTVDQPTGQRQVETRTSRRRWVGTGRGLRISELVLLSVLVVDAFLALDFVFRATAVAGDGFVSIVDRVGNALASPFAGIFRSGVPAVGHTTFWAALLALAVYTIAALIVVRLLHLLSSPLRRRSSPA
ncbi:MAG TPA: hypothetical protein VI138_06630 [Candidatus Dormibacteraeota bacterium]